MQKYLIFIDVDGTLVPTGTFNMDKRLPAVFEKAEKDGHIVIIVTGRSLRSVYGIDGIQSAKYISGLMGCVTVEAKTKEVYIKPTPMDRQTVIDFINDINAQKLMWTYKDDYSQKTYFNDPVLIKKYTTVVVSYEEAMQDINDGKVCQLLVDGEIPQSIIDKYCDFDYFKMPTGYYDITIKGISKANIIKTFASKYPEYTTVAIGDSNNDIPMLKECNIKIAMGNANDNVKSLANYVTKSVNDGGVYDALKDFLNI